MAFIYYGGTLALGIDVFIGNMRASANAANIKMMPRRA